MINKLSIILAILSLTSGAQASVLRTVNEDQLQSSDTLKTWSMPGQSDTLTGISTTATLTNKTISGSSNTFISIPDSSITYAAQSRNKGFFSPASGGNAPPTFRLQALADVPSLQVPDVRNVNFLNGSDTVCGSPIIPPCGDGSALYPWKTLQTACTAVASMASVQRVVTIKLTGGDNDSDSVNPITCPPNVIITSDDPVTLSQPLLITSATGGNDTLSLYNISGTSLSWTKNDSTTNTVILVNIGFTSSVVLKQSGSGALLLVATNPNVVNWDTKIGPSGVAIISNPYWGGTISLEDEPASAYYQIMSGYIYGACTISGGQLLYMSGIQFDVPGGASLAGVATGNGTPFIQSDNSSIPNAISGSYSLQPTTFTYQSASGSQPTCSAANRGLQWLIDGPAGVADIFQICQKNVVNAYVWTTH